MTFEEADRRYAELREAMIGRRMTSEQLSAALAELQVQDAQGTWWRVDPLSGDWLRWDGSAWRPAAPPSPEASPVVPAQEPLRIVVETIDASGKPASSLSHAGRDVLWILAQCQAEGGTPSAAGDATVRFSSQFERTWATLADQGFQRGRRCAAVRLVHPPPSTPPPPHLVVTVTAGAEGRTCLPVTLALDLPQEAPAVPARPAASPLHEALPHEAPTPEPCCPMAWHLVVQTAPDVGLTIPVHERTRLGRCPDNDLCPDYPDVSRYHAVLEVHDDLCELQDLKSTHGTRVNGVPVTGTQPLCDGDLVELSSFRFYVRRQPVAPAVASSGASTSSLPTLQARPDERVVSPPPSPRSPSGPAPSQGPAPPASPPEPPLLRAPSLGPALSGSPPEPPLLPAPARGPALSASPPEPPQLPAPARGPAPPASPSESVPPSAPTGSSKTPSREACPAPPVPQATLTCPTCQELSPAGAIFCVHCGGRVPPPRSPDQCPACGRKARAGARFCTGCGRPMKP